jgi:hypothetical protein
VGMTSAGMTPSTLAEPAPVVEFDPLLDEDGAAAMLSLCDAFGGYGMYSNEGFETGYAPELPQRVDAVLNYLAGKEGASEDVAAVAARTNYFRETYAYGEDILAPGIEPFRTHDGLVDAARALHGRDLIVPAIVYANLLVPGQELATHTDVPEFRGANRKITPQWLLVVMRHSGIFEDWRMPIATGIAYFGSAGGGSLHYFPDGADGPVAEFATDHNSAVLLDTDSIFHGVDRVRGADEDAVAALRPGQRLVPGPGSWRVIDPDRPREPVATYAEDDVRLSISWKAYCFEDDAERRRWEGHQDDLDLEVVLDGLEADLRAGGGLSGPRPAPAAFAALLMDHYIAFPPPVLT